MHGNIKTKNVAVIGISCRFPSGADTPHAFWDLLAKQQNIICTLPPKRWRMSEAKAVQSYC
jgi:acyl transferase domain-containing protein